MVSINPDNSYVSVEQKNILLDFLKEEYQLDFTHYSEASVRRRIAKILSTLKLPDVETYMELLQDDSYEIHDFLSLFTVNVTEMFRDPFCYKALAEEVFPQFKFKEKIRVWSAGCSSGEELLALAILFEEAGLLERCEFLGTDISEATLDKARAASYQQRHVESYNQAYQAAGGKKQLSDYYREGADEVKFHQHLLEKVNFKQHNLLDEAPEGPFDLISCRNVLIYFDSYLQNQVLKKLYSSLADKAYLMIGSKENILFYEDRSLLKEVQHDIRIYQKA